MRIKLNLPCYQPTTRPRENSLLHETEVFDIVRKRWVALTPEEEVRQGFIHFMINHLSIPVTHIGVEHSFNFDNGKPQRADILVYNKDAQPIMVIECKAPDVKITSKIFTQASRYNAYIKARYIIITNGLSHYCFSTLDLINYKQEKTIPDYITMQM